LFGQGIPDPFARNAEFAPDCCDYIPHCIERGYQYEGIPLTEINPPFPATDGPFMVACAIHGASDLCMDLYEDPDYAYKLFVSSRKPPSRGSRSGADSSACPKSRPTQPFIYR